MKIFIALFHDSDAKYNRPHIVSATTKDELFKKALAYTVDCWDYDGSAKTLDELVEWMQENDESDDSFIYVYEEDIATI
jgi:hypothetical protein